MQPAIRNEEELLEKAVVRLNARLMGIIFGLILGAGLFLATNFLVIKDGSNAGPHLGLLSHYLPGYSVTFAGSLIGFVYAFGVGFAIGAILGALYNRLAEV